MTSTSLHAFANIKDDADIAFARAKYDDKESWPSELADGGRVGWKKFREDADGWVSVKYPEVRYVAGSFWMNIVHRCN